MVDKILFGYGSVGNDHPIGEGQRFNNGEMEQKSYDPDKAKWHLEQAGLDSIDVSLSAADAAFVGAVEDAVFSDPFAFFDRVSCAVGPAGEGFSVEEICKTIVSVAEGKEGKKGERASWVRHVVVENGQREEFFSKAD